jgi:tetratricopeptide (TPR) repeat protein
MSLPFPTRFFKNNVFLGLPLLLLTLCLASAARADIIHLKNGKTLSGEVIQEGPDYVVIKVPCGEVKLKKSEIDVIERQTPQEYKLELAQQFIQRHNFDRALQTLEEIRRLDANNSEALRLEAAVYEMRGQLCRDNRRWTEAKEAFEKLLQLDPEAKLISHHAAAVLRQIAQRQEGLTDLLAKARGLTAAEEWTGAIKAYEEALGASPDCRLSAAPSMARCYAGRAAEEAQKGHRLNAAADIEAALRLDPAQADSLESLYVYCALPPVLASLEHGDAGSARVDLERILTFAPTNKHVLYDAGRMEEALNKVAEAANDYARALHLQAVNPTAEYTARLRRDLETELKIKDNQWKIEVEPDRAKEFAKSSDGPAQTLETENFHIIHYNKELAARVGEAAEYHRTRILAELNLPICWPGKAKIYLHRTQSEYTARTGQPEWTGGCSKFSLNGFKTLQVELHSWQTSPRLLKSVLPHELAHLLMAANMADPNVLPKCLHEGFAVSMEPQFRRDYFLSFLRLRLQSQDFIPLADLLQAASYPRDPEFFYAEGWSLVQYLNTLRGKEAVAGIIKQVKHAGQIQDELLRLGGASSLDDLESGWKKWILNGK